MSISLYNKKTIKSTLFLLPLIGVSKTSPFPCKRTCVICKELGINEKSKRLITVYEKSNKLDFSGYEGKILLGNKLFIEKHETETEYVYVFDFSYLKDNWNRFINGEYSRLSTEIKKRLLEYHIIVGKDGVRKEHRFMTEILYPQNPTSTETNGVRVDYVDAFERYSDALGIDVELMREIGEVYSKPSLEDETLEIRLITG